MDIKVLRCKICGEVFIGKALPSNCPYCGVENKFLIDGSAYKDENDVELTDISKKNLEKALSIELSNTAFYKCIANTSTEPLIAAMFKGLSKIEKEHADVFRKILKPESDPEINETCSDDSLASLNSSKERETRATVFYSQALKEATENRLKEVFTAIMKTEHDHLALDNEMIKKYK
ncbi:ferritin-like domain-containing protein [Patescibacteria group bacterium]|nr:ferritin-like domain-containing protein [Patescibacteria group bacterium]